MSYPHSEEFRNHIPYENEEGNRKWIYPKKPSGKYHRLRIIVTTILLTILMGVPFIKINGHPLIMLNFFDRQFIILGNVFWPQDTHLLILLLLSLFVFVILFTTVFGRIWCGWACPQTLFMEMVFRKIEYWIEGDSNQQRKLNAQPWDAEKLRKRMIKHGIFIIISMLIGHTVMAYLIGIDQTVEIIQHSPAENLAGFIGLLVFSGIFYIVFSIVREHVCTFICPYGRLQSVLINKETIVVGYNELRGEPRGKITKKETETKKGDCVDCGLCVQVCPTGIDIRNGIQMECVNCTACIDACDEVMEKIHKPKGLIRYDSLVGFKENKPFRFNTRIIGYSIVLLIILSVFLGLIFTRSDMETTIVRASGQLYQDKGEGIISNLFNVHVINKTFNNKKIGFRLKNTKGEIKIIGGKQELQLNGQDILKEVMEIDIPKTEIKELKTKLIIEVIADGKVIEETTTTFLGPAHKK